MNTYIFLNDKLLAQLENENITLKKRAGIFAVAKQGLDGDVEGLKSKSRPQLFPYLICFILIYLPAFSVNYD